MPSDKPKTKKSKKSKKAKKEKKEPKVVEEEMVDIDVPESDDEEEPESNIIDPSESLKPEDETEAVEELEKGEVMATATPVNDKSSFAKALQFTPAEIPLLGYALASLIFFFAAVNRKYSVKSFNNNSSAMGSTDDLASAIMDNVFEDIDWTTGELGNDDVFSYLDDGMFTYDDDWGSVGSICGGYGAYGGKLLPGYYAYALCLGIFGLLMAVAVLAWSRYNNSLAAKRNGFGDEITTEEDPNKSASERILDNYRWLMNSLLFVWAFIGWAVFTFGAGEVFAHTGNGFFALWAMMLFSIWNFGVTVDLAETVRGADSCIYGMTLASLITLIELTAGWAGMPWKWRPYSGISSYCLAVSVVGLLFGLTTAILAKVQGGGKQLSPLIRFWFVVVLSVMWIVAACLSTFIGPFLTTGNGYFAVWGAVLFCGLSFSTIQEEM